MKKTSKQRFIEGLRHYNLKYEEIFNGGWTYAGGEPGSDMIDPSRKRQSHYNYFKLMFGHDRTPPPSTHCVCGHKIKQNCYIVDKTKKKFVHLGNCCIKKFMIGASSGRTCEECGDKHINRKDNKCNECRIPKCKYCNKRDNKIKSICLDCESIRCIRCLKITDRKKYPICYICRKQ